MRASDEQRDGDAGLTRARQRSRSIINEPRFPGELLELRPLRPEDWIELYAVAQSSRRWTFLARSQWGGPCNREMERLMLDHAFEHVDRAVFLVGVQNSRSQRAMMKIGGVLRDRIVRRTLQRTTSDFVVFEIRKLAAH